MDFPYYRGRLSAVGVSSLSRREREKGSRVRVVSEKTYPCEPGEGAKSEGRVGTPSKDSKNVEDKGEEERHARGTSLGKELS
jgi:hypothetical protein